VSLTEIVSKTFYVVVPFAPPAFGGAKTGPLGISNIFGNLLGGKKTKKNSFEEGKFEEYKSQLLQRGETVIQGLSRTGVRVVPLNTEELIELFYKLYNPEEFAKGSPPAERLDMTMSQPEI
jgi:hypothetical protein